MRIGFDANSTVLLDTADHTKPYLQPVPFGYQGRPKWEITLIVPTTWVGAKKRNEEFVLRVYNIWYDESQELTFGLGDQWKASSTGDSGSGGGNGGKGPNK